MNNILNNLWIAISTPNKTLTDFMAIPLLFLFESPLSFYLISNVFKLNCTKFQKYIYIISTSIVAIIASFCIPWPFSIIMNYTCTFIILFFVMRLNFIKALIATIFPSIVFNLVESLIGKLYLHILNITYDQNMTILFYRLPFNLLVYIIIFIINLFFKYANITIPLLEKFDKKTKSIIILNLFFGILNILAQGTLGLKYIDVLPVEYSIFNFVFLLVYVILSFYTLIKITNLTVTKQKLESAEEYNKTLHILHDSVRGFKHDFDNIITTIGGYISTDDKEGLKKYYAQLREDSSKVNNLYILNPDTINNPGIYNLLTQKYNKADEKDINVNLTFLLDLNNLHMKIYEFARILGILLDNAIDAAAECNEKILNLEFRNESKNNRNIILIENTYKDKDVDINKIFSKGVSGKENHTGLGLWEVRQILKRNNNVNLYTDKNDRYFLQQLEIYY